MNSLFSDQVRRIAFVPQHATDPSQDRWLTWLAWGCLAVYAVFFFAFTDATTHTVDGVRDFEVARSIARGEFFPIVSQPFAGRFQTPPAYFYFIAIPIMLGGEEHAVMLWIAAICFASVCLLRWQLAKSFGRTVGNLYTITACVFPTSIFLHSLTNPSLAYAFSGLILACVLALWRGERRWGGVLVLALVLIVQMHLSSLPLLVAVGLVALRFHRRMLSRGAWVMALLCVALCGFWLMQYGYLASNALPQESASANATATGLAIIARLFNLSHWWDIASIYQQFASALVDAPAWIWMCTAFLGVVVAFGVSVVSIAVLRVGGERSLVAVLLFITGLTATMMVAYLTHWGLWYFEVLQPWISTLSALGLSLVIAWTHQISRTSVNGVVIQRMSFSLICIVALSNVLPQSWLHRRLAVHGEIMLRTSGLFFPGRANFDQPIPLTSAGTQFAFRQWLATRPGMCTNNVVGSYEWMLRDMTLRSAYSDCRDLPQPAIIGSPTLLSTHTRFGPAGSFVNALPIAWQRGNSRVYDMPPQRVSINGESTNQLFSNEKVTYGFYSPRRLPAGVSVTFYVQDGTSSAGHIALRCINIPAQPNIVWRGGGGAELPNSSLVFDASLLGLRYLEYEFELPVGGTGGGNGAVVKNIQPLDCDVSAFTTPLNKP